MHRSACGTGRRIGRARAGGGDAAERGQQRRTGGRGEERDNGSERETGEQGGNGPAGRGRGAEGSMTSESSAGAAQSVPRAGESLATILSWPTSVF